MKAKSMPIFFWLLTLYMAVIWLVIVFGLNLGIADFEWSGDFNFVENFNVTLLRGSIGKMAEEIFWLAKVKGGTNVGQAVNVIPNFLLSSLALIGRFYNGFFIHLPHNVFGVSFIFIHHFVTKDFFAAVISKKIPTRQVKVPLT